MTNQMMDQMNVSGYGWFLCMLFICFLLNTILD